MHNNSPSAGFDVVKKEPSERLYSPDLGLGGVGGSAGGSYHLGAAGGGGSSSHFHPHHLGSPPSLSGPHHHLHDLHSGLGSTTRPSPSLHPSLDPRNHGGLDGGHVGHSLGGAPDLLGGANRDNCHPGLIPRDNSPHGVAGVGSHHHHHAPGGLLDHHSAAAAAAFFRSEADSHQRLC